MSLDTSLFSSRLGNVMCRRALWLVLAVMLGVVGCKKDKRPRFNADERSGPDALRSGAVLIPVNMTVTDDVNYEQRDQTDWKKVELQGHAGVLEVEIRWDNANSDISCAVFNSFGEEVAASPAPSPGQQVKKVALEAKPGVYYLRIQAPKKGDFSVYSLTARWNGEEAPPPPQPPQPTTHKPSGPKPPKSKPPETRSVQGRIVSSYREGAQLVLHLDKGAAAGVKVGNTGSVLDGPSGSTTLEGGSFTISQVIDDRKSVAKTSLKSLGRNTRVIIYTTGK